MLCFAFQKIPCPCTLPRNQLRNTSISCITRTSNFFPRSLLARPVFFSCLFAGSRNGRRHFGAYMWRSNVLGLRNCSSIASASYGVRSLRWYSSAKSLPVTKDEFKRALGWGLLGDAPVTFPSQQALGRYHGAA